jgi:carbamoyltransferase
MTAILGISAFYHDSAAAMVVDGRIVAAAQEERFTRKKHDEGFPHRAIEYCLKEAGLTAEQIDYVAFYDKPLLKFDRLLETYLAYAPAGFRSFVKAMPQWVKQKLHLPREISKGLGGKYTKRIVFTDHHESHAASAFFPSPFDEAAVITLDGVGEWATASFGHGRGNSLTLSHELHFPHSLGLLYSAFTYYCGFRVNSGEYKLMGLAPYGEPTFADAIRQNLLDVKEDGSFRMDMSYFNYCQGLTMTSDKFHRLFGGPPRRPDKDPVTQRDMDLAASIQLVTEEIMLKIARHVHKQTGSKNLCLAGGVALNCVGNGKILRDGPFEKIWIQPAAGDAGGALGAALFTWHQLLGKPRTPTGPDNQSGSLLGPRATNDEIKSFLDAKGATYHHLPGEEQLCDFVADLMASENVVGWVQGRMEFGPRALGSRSIIGDARSRNMQSVMNLKIKFRESFRPFAPSVLRERVDDFFQMRPNEDSPYMLLVAPVQDDKRVHVNGDSAHLKGIDKLKVARSQVPAVTHVDYSARVQTVDAERHGRYYRLIRAFEKKTGCPVIINTSFNVRGEPIVCTPADAYRCFLGTQMDVLVLENFVLIKKEQTNAPKVDTADYLAQFKLD